jgi:hypothetical protein
MSTPARSIAGMLAALALVAACGGSTPSPTAAPATPTVVPATTAPTSAPATVLPTTPPQPTILRATAVTGTGAMVDLHFTGTRVIFAVGTNGACKLVSVDGATKFSFEATGADYPAFGESFSVAELDSISIKWVIDGNIAYASSPTAVIEISPDHHTVTLDQDLDPLTSAGGTIPGPQHVKGTISCQ